MYTVVMCIGNNILVGFCISRNAKVTGRILGD